MPCLYEFTKPNRALYTLVLLCHLVVLSLSLARYSTEIFVVDSRFRGNDKTYITWREDHLAEKCLQIEFAAPVE